VEADVKQSLASKIYEMKRPLLALCFHAGVLRGLFFDPEDKDNIVTYGPFLSNG
jgi:hypothetical protein